MSKSATPRALSANQAQAVLRGIKGSYTKAQLVMDLIRGKTVERALNELAFCRKKQAAVVRKVLQSAIANAENNHSLNVDKLVVQQAFADKAMLLSRWHARARGRAAPVMKHTCHLTVVVAEAAPKAAKPEAKKAAPKKVAKAEAKSEAKSESVAATTEKTEA